MGKEINKQEILNRIKQLCEAFCDEGDRQWYIWVSESGYVSAQDGFPIDADRFYCFPAYDREQFDQFFDESCLWDWLELEEVKDVG